MCLIGKVSAAIGGALLVLGVLAVIVSPLLMAPPPAAVGANIGAGLFALAGLVLLGVGLVATMVGIALWVAARRRRTSTGRSAEAPGRPGT